MYIFDFVVLFLLFIIFYFVFNKKKENFTNIWLYYNDKSKKPSGGLGNILSAFFTNKTKNILNENKEVYELNESEKNFIKLEKYFKIDDTKKEEIKSLKFFNGPFQWNFFKCKTLTFWNILNPNINISLNKFFEDIEIPIIENIPILHFRCSDVPFELHGDYHFSKYKYYKWCHNKLKSKYKKWYIMFNNNHLSNEKYKKLSTIYFNDLKKYLVEILKLEIEILKPNNQYQDLKLLYNSDVVIQGGCGGSFCFFAGFFNKQYFFTDVNKNEDLYKYKCEYKNDLDKIDNIFYFPNGLIKHSEIKTVGGYENTNSVIKLLRN
jgi:hypothetical protein